MAVLFALPLLTACGLIYEPEAEDVKQTNDISVSFRLFTGNSESRAVDYYGTAADNHVDLNNLKILIFDENQKLKQVLYDDGEMDVQKTSFKEISRGFYELKTRLDPARYNTTSRFAIVALANWRTDDSSKGLSCDWNGHAIDDSETGVLTIADLKAMTFTLNPQTADAQSDSWMPADGSWIPMFGSRFTSLAGYTNDVFGEANPMPIPDVQLVRAFSKIEIVNNDVDGGPVIDNITFSPRNQSGMLVPDYNFNGATANVSATTIPANPGFTNSSIPFHKEGNTYTVYVPEMEFNLTDYRRAICVNLDMNGVKHQKWIYLAPYGADGRPVLNSGFDSDWDALKRNYVYQYVINSLAFEFLVDVQPWIFGGKVHIPLQ